MNPGESSVPTFNWDTASRRDGMVRFGPIVGADILAINDVYQDRQRDITIKVAVDACNETLDKNESLTVPVILGHLAWACKNYTEESLRSARRQDTGTVIKLEDYGISDDWQAEENLFWPYRDTLTNTMGGVFTTVSYCLLLLEKTGTTLDNSHDMEATLAIIRQPWFPEFMREVADAPQFFWDIPDPDHSNVVTIADNVEGKLKQITEATDLSRGSLIELSDAGCKLSPLFRDYINQEKLAATEKYDTKKTRSDTERNWALKTTSGCPARHKRIGSRAIEEAFTIEQIAAFAEQGVLTKADAGYEMYDFMKFTADFVADHLEHMKEQLENITTL